jgi:hypothetical protein
LQATASPASQPSVPAIRANPHTLFRSQSTASLEPERSVAVSGAKTDDQRRARFNEHYKTAMLSDDEVLSLYSLIFFPAFFSDDPVEKQINQWTSEVYKHFKMPPTISVNKGVVTYVFTCIA